MNISVKKIGLIVVEPEDGVRIFYESGPGMYTSYYTKIKWNIK